jgi:hypothetical protein
MISDWRFFPGKYRARASENVYCSANPHRHHKDIRRLPRYGTSLVPQKFEVHIVQIYISLFSLQCEPFQAMDYCNESVGHHPIIHSRLFFWV